VLSNLVANALQHSPPGTPVSVRLEGVESLQRVEVHNAGPPIPAALRSRLFEPFHRAESTAARPPRAGGLGLGLYIVGQIIQAHGGTVEVSSTVEEGTSFVLVLPRSVPAPSGTVEDSNSPLDQPGERCA
jgi:signal transduction histidine kinase